MKRSWLVLVLFLFLVGMGWPMTVMANETLMFPVVAGADDAEEGDDGPGFMDIDSSDLELTWDHDDPSRAQTIGLRFANVDVPQWTPIVAAYIQFACDEPDKNRNPFDVTIFGEAADDAGPYENTDYNISSRDRTGTSVQWVGIPDWTVEHEAGENQRTPDLSAVVQEIVDRDGWTAGNAMALILEGEGTRTAESYDGASELAPTLVIALPSTEAYRVTAGNDDAEEGDDGPGVMDIDSSDLELAWDHDDPNRAQTIGVRFANVTIPQGATILSAAIQFACDEPDKNRNPFNVTISGEAVDDAALYENIDNNISSRSRTVTSVIWADIPDWTVEHEAGENQRTPDLGAMVQEIVNRSGWAEGNALAFILEGEGTRTAESFDGASELAPTLLVTFIGEQTAPSNARYRLVWDDDPATTMLIAWDQLRGSNPVVYYGTEDFGTNYQQYPLSQAPTRVDTYRGMNNHFAKLTGLTPDTAYYFVIRDSETVSPRIWFKTAPAAPQPFTFIYGGDTKSSGQAYLAGLQSNRMVPKLRPLFILYGGDFNSGDGTNDAYWQQWLTDWATLTMTEDGRLFPILPVHGNHENGDLEQIYRLFGAGNDDPQQPLNYTYNSRAIGGNLLQIITLNSCLKYMAPDDQPRQTEWLGEKLAAASGNYTFLTAVHHKPIRPHTASKSENEDLDVWFDLYHQFGLDLNFDADSHMNKITFPIRPCEEGEEGCFQGYVRDDEDGTMVLGEGSWGAWHRPNDDDKPWTLHSSSLQQFKWIQVFPAEGENPARMDIRTVITGTEDGEGNLVDHVTGVGENSEEDVFSVPENIYLDEVPYYGNVITYPVTAIPGDPPSAPINLSGIATSYTEIELSWTNTADPADVRSLHLERKTGAEGAWGMVDSNISGDATTYAQSNLNDGTDYYYRLCAANIFGVSGYSNEALVSTPVDPRFRLVFQESADGYQGTVDLELRASSPDTVFDGNYEMTVDMEDGGVVHGMMRFKNLFGRGLGLIPPEAVIDQAELRVWTSGSTGNDVSFHRMLTDWPDACTWNSLGGDGVTPDDVEAASAADDVLHEPKSDNFHFVDVSNSLLAWQDEAGNYGWGIINSGTDGWDVITSEVSHLHPEYQEFSPRLTVYYTLPGDLDQNGIVDRDDIDVIKTYRNQPATACPDCDIDGDGTITVLDARKLILLCTCSRCVCP